ncbi:MAG: ATP-binding cassette domain-containing protein [Calditrichaeota bacterium]|nr:MAG: ATP-binding cassette domain-containing protein [Calditrichota bacterium]
MIFLREITLGKTSKKSFPFNLPTIQNLDSLTFGSEVTFLVGENGSGKSTLIEAIALGAKLVGVGSENLEDDESLFPSKKLSKELKFIFSQRPLRGLFFRAEDCFGFTKRIKSEMRELEAFEKDFSEKLSGYGKELAVGTVRGQRVALEQKYGKNPHAKSHGETFLDLFQKRVVSKGLYLLDEPETPLSPLRQLALLSLLKEMISKGCQFIIATHSPILMAFPKARIYCFGENEIRESSYEKVEHVSLTKAFLENPESFLSKL